MPIADTQCHASLDWYEPIETLTRLAERGASGVRRQADRDLIFGQVGLSVFRVGT